MVSEINNCQTKAFIHFQSDNYCSVPKADTRNINLGGNLRPGADAHSHQIMARISF
jgi:hypothetical protein